MQATAGLIVILAILAVLLVDVGLLVVAFVRRDAERAGLARPLFAPRWSLVDVWFGGQIAVAGTLLVAALVMSSLAAMRPRPGVPVAPQAAEAAMLRLIVPLLIAQSVMFVLVPAVYIVGKYRTPLSGIGLGWPPGRRALHAAWLCPLMLVVGMGLAAGIPYAMRAALGPATYRALEDATKSIGKQEFVEDALRAPGLAIPILIVGGLVAPIGEEFFFRGFLFNSAKRRLGFWGGALLSGMLFGLAHGGPLLILAIVPIGVMLAWAYEWTGSLWVPILMHACFNTTQLLRALFTGANV